MNNKFTIYVSNRGVSTPIKAYNFARHDTYFSRSIAHVGKRLACQFLVKIKFESASD